MIRRPPRSTLFPYTTLFRSDGVLFLPVVIPEITQGISLLVFFNIVFEYFGRLTGAEFQRGFATVIIAHVAFNIDRKSTRLNSSH